MTPNMISVCEVHVAATPGVSVPIVFPNTDVPDSAKTYVRFFVMASEDTIPLGLGETAKSRNVGLIQATVTGPRGKGAGEVGEIAHALWARFKRATLEVPEEGWITFKDGSVKEVGENNQEYTAIVRVPYYYDFYAG